MTEKQRGRSYYYHVGKKKFELAELKLLVDAIQSSKFITVKKSHELIRKLESFFSYIMRALSSSLTVIYEGTGIRIRILNINSTSHRLIDVTYIAFTIHPLLTKQKLFGSIGKILVMSIEHSNTLSTQYNTVLCLLLCR